MAGGVAGGVTGTVLDITIGLEGTARSVGVAVTVGLEEGISAEWGISTGRYGDKVAVRAAEVLLTGKVYKSCRGVCAETGVDAAADLGATGLCGDSPDKSHLLGCMRLFLLYLHSVRKCLCS